MNGLKHILILFFFFNLTLPVNAQKGFDVIRKAERKFEKGQNKRALKLLSKAENMNYGFCGNAKGEANESINRLRAKIYIEQKEYELARNSLDSVNWPYYQNFDSIKIRTYQMEYGKDSLSNMIDSSLVNTKIECGEDCDCIAIIPLTNGKSIKMKFLLYDLDWLKMDDKKKAEVWVNRFKESENYKLMKERS